ncbi:hypothetical protein FRC12_002462 [Ceratobasidium sp. 428]|nr:hypothetical protein FRC12_002462 [Ceratobasidium sp. 428]
MGNFYDSIPEFLMSWIAEQHCFWVATAPLSADGHVNVSPKSMAGTFKLLGPNACFYQDLSGSGSARFKARPVSSGSGEQASSTFSFLLSFSTHQHAGVVHEIDTPRYAELIPLAERLPGSRAAIEVKIHKVGSSCGYSVPFYTWTADRTLLVNRMATREERDQEICAQEAKSDDDPLVHLKITAQNPLSPNEAPEKSLRKYWSVKNVRSIDGIPGLELGRRLAGLPPSERDAVKDNTLFHQPVEGKMGINWRWWRWDIMGAFALGLCATQLVGIVKHSMRHANL